MFFNWFDHPLIANWREAGLRAELHREDPAPTNDRPPERLEVPVIETLSDADGEAIELPPVHALHTDAPGGHNDGRRR